MVSYHTSDTVTTITSQPYSPDRIYDPYPRQALRIGYRTWGWNNSTFNSMISEHSPECNRMHTYTMGLRVSRVCGAGNTGLLPAGYFQHFRYYFTTKQPNQSELRQYCTSCGLQWYVAMQEYFSSDIMH
jgi:hypothetical protein